jgi:hypothetical protein
MIDMLPDELLLDIFDHIRLSRADFKSRHITQAVWKWHILVHVCRRWRRIVFASPLRLDLQLLCTYGTPVRKYLACWPGFPIVIDYSSFGQLTPNDEDNIIAALEHRGRIRQIKLRVSSSLWSKMATFMRHPFPALTSLWVSALNRKVPLLLPVGFLGRSAPGLREIWFQGFPTPTLPTFLSYTSDLVKLALTERNAHLTSCISPAALVVCLAMLPRLENLSIMLPSSWTSRTDYWQTLLPPNTRVVLPALTSFSFDGGCTYLEDFVAKIDTPGLDTVDITFWDSPDYRIPQLSEFINRTALKPSQFEDTKLYFDGGDTVIFHLSHGPSIPPISIEIPSCDGISSQVWCMAQVLRQISAILSNVVRLEIKAESREEEDEDMADIDWLELLCPFTAVETLHVYADSEFAGSIAHAFEDTLAETDNRVLAAPNLEGETAKSVECLALLPGRDRTILIRYEEFNSEGSESENDRPCSHSLC